MKFRVINGKHIQGTTVFEVGEMVESDRPLDQIFKNKFHRVHEAAAIERTREERQQRRRTKPPTARPTAILRPQGDGYDVLNPVTGKRINTKPLTEEEAQALVEG